MRDRIIKTKNLTTYDCCDASSYFSIIPKILNELAHEFNFQSGKNK